MTKSFFDESNIEDWKKLSPKDGVLLFIEFMETVARDSLSDKVLGPEEKKTLKVAMEGLRPAFELLEASMGVRTDVTYTALHWLMSRSFTVGQHVGFLDERARDVFRVVQAGSGSDANVAKASRRNQALDAAIVEECKATGKMAISIEFANLIRPGVLRRLKLTSESKYPSIWQIKHRLSKLSKIKSVSS